MIRRGPLPYAIPPHSANQPIHAPQPQTPRTRPAQALLVRPAELLDRPKPPLSRGFSPASGPAEPLVSYQRNRQHAGWHRPPLVHRAAWAHREIRGNLTDRRDPALGRHRTDTVETGISSHGGR